MNPQYDHFSLVGWQLGQRGTQQLQLFIAHNQLARIIQLWGCRAIQLWVESPHPVSGCPHQITNTISNTFGQVGSHAACESEVVQCPGKGDENVMNGVFRGIDIVRESNSQNEQAIPVSLI